MKLSLNVFVTKVSSGPLCLCTELILCWILGIDELLAKHISHLFIRDPLVIFSETIHQDDSASNDHFEVISLFPPYLPTVLKL